uniref:Uncharacterized protein n=1 Tax=Rhizophora mucronata TaxID=61149 RepID=A0A2P2N436_RHIMU
MHLKIRPKSGKPNYGQKGVREKFCSL